MDFDAIREAYLSEQEELENEKASDDHMKGVTTRAVFGVTLEHMAAVYGREKAIESAEKTIGNLTLALERFKSGNLL